MQACYVESTMTMQKDMRRGSNHIHEEAESLSETLFRIQNTVEQSDEEKTSTDQDEDIKVSTYNSDEENTSSEEEEIDIQNPWILNQQIFMGKEK
ncbi:hypothetical protein Gotur_034112 [Gossypium turneri]